MLMIIYTFLYLEHFVLIEDVKIPKIVSLISKLRKELEPCESSVYYMLSSININKY